MLSYILRRVVYMIPTVLIISVICFVIIQLPPGDYIDSYVTMLKSQGDTVSEDELEVLRKRYGTDESPVVQYLKWMSGVVQGDFGQSFEWNAPVSKLIKERLPLTLVVSLASLFVSYLIGVSIGIYAATHQYSVGDYIFSFLGFVGVATPGFLIALILMFVFYKYFGLSIGGLFSIKYLDSPWSFGKVMDLINHMWIPLLVIGLEGTCGLIRVMRGTLLDELAKQYVVTARAKGVGRMKLLFKYPVRVAINPIISTVGWLLPGIFSGSTIISIVLALETTGPLLLRSLMSQDMYLAGSFLFILAVLTVIGTLVSDILLAIVDPRIRIGRKS